MLFQALTSQPNPVRWEEAGVCEAAYFPPQEQRDRLGLKGKERLDFIRTATIDTIVWRTAGILRYAHPIRLGDILEELEYCWKQQLFKRGKHVHEDPYALHLSFVNNLFLGLTRIFCVYLASARELVGGDTQYDTVTLGMLTPQFLDTMGMLGQRNYLLACCTSARLCRRLRRDAEEREMIVRIAHWIQGHLHALPPGKIQQNLDQETMRRITAHLERDPFQGIITVENDLMYDRNLGAYVRTEFMRPQKHQKQAWPMHKQFCAQYKEEKAKYIELDLD
ncbi:hypothetical protein H0H81_002767 [Sphagnurus paluster]|uniref:Uncharacterized protein n=1 Tax=Sphagnurus paluster TaxID=117069 RepID=A0A9P7FNG9_9AGAR|nr:hypothetical protein H0H81_002767 [Sphagnurus paluster]